MSGDIVVQEKRGGDSDVALQDEWTAGDVSRELGENAGRLSSEGVHDGLMLPFPDSRLSPFPTMTIS